MATDVDKYKQDKVLDEIEPSSTTLKKANFFVDSKEFPKPKHWTAEELNKLDFPSDLTLLNIDQLGEQMGLWTSVIAYTQYQVAMADVESTAKINKFEYEKAKLYLQLVDTGKGTEAQKQAHLKSNPELSKLHADSELAKAKYTLLKALLSAYSKYYGAFSRELSRRGVIGGERPPFELPREDDDVDISEDRKRGESLIKKFRKEVDDD